MAPGAFLKRWKSEHISSGTQQADTPDLVETLLADAAKEGISRDRLERAAGRTLEDYLIGSIREAIEEELW